MATERADLAQLGRYAFLRLRERMAGLTEEEYRWGPGPGVSTLAWRLGHVAELLAAERNAAWLGVAAPSSGGRASITAAGALDALDAAFAWWSEVLDAVPVQSPAEPIGPVGGPYAESTRRAFVLHVLDELIHHGAEAALLRDLWAARHPDR